VHAGIPPSQRKAQSKALMEILDGYPSCLARVDIAPPKLDCNGVRVLLNPNETMAPRALQNEMSNNNAKVKG
jgi:hypothetical protein